MVAGGRIVKDDSKRSTLASSIILFFINKEKFQIYSIVLQTVVYEIPKYALLGL